MTNLKKGKLMKYAIATSLLAATFVASACSENKPQEVNDLYLRVNVLVHTLEGDVTPSAEICEATSLSLSANADRANKNDVSQRVVKPTEPQPGTLDTDGCAIIFDNSSGLFKGLVYDGNFVVPGEFVHPGPQKIRIDDAPEPRVYTFVLQRAVDADAVAAGVSSALLDGGFATNVANEVWANQPDGGTSPTAEEIAEEVWNQAPDGGAAGNGGGGFPDGGVDLSDAAVAAVAKAVCERTGTCDMDGGINVNVTVTEPTGQVCYTPVDNAGTPFTGCTYEVSGVATDSDPIPTDDNGDPQFTCNGLYLDAVEPGDLWITASCDDGVRLTRKVVVVGGKYVVQDSRTIIAVGTGDLCTTAQTVTVGTNHSVDVTDILGRGQNDSCDKAALSDADRALALVDCDPGAGGDAGVGSSPCERLVINGTVVSGDFTGMDANEKIIATAMIDVDGEVIYLDVRVKNGEVAILTGN